MRVPDPDVDHLGVQAAVRRARVAGRGIAIIAGLRQLDADRVITTIGAGAIVVAHLAAARPDVGAVALLPELGVDHRAVAQRRLAIRGAVRISFWVAGLAGSDVPVTAGRQQAANDTIVIVGVVAVVTLLVGLQHTIAARRLRRGRGVARGRFPGRQIPGGRHRRRRAHAGRGDPRRHHPRAGRAAGVRRELGLIEAGLREQAGEQDRRALQHGAPAFQKLA